MADDGISSASNWLGNTAKHVGGVASGLGLIGGGLQIADGVGEIMDGVGWGSNGEADGVGGWWDVLPGPVQLCLVQLDSEQLMEPARVGAAATGGTAAAGLGTAVGAAGALCCSCSWRRARCWSHPCTTRKQLYLRYRRHDDRGGWSGTKLVRVGRRRSLE